MPCLSKTTIAVVKAKVPSLKTQGVTIAQQAYDRIFEDPAAVRALFDQPLREATSSQSAALAAAIAPYAKSIDDLGALAIGVERIKQNNLQAIVAPASLSNAADALIEFTKSG
jgi:nitric oxide dioxygenase